MAQVLKPPGWHREQIKAALRMRGHSFASIGRAYGYAQPHTPGAVLSRPWPFMEKAIADLLGVPPCQIWPSRYTATGNPKGHGIRGQYTKRAKPHNGKSGEAA